MHGGNSTFPQGPSTITLSGVGSDVNLPKRWPGEIRTDIDEFILRFEQIAKETSIRAEQLRAELVACEQVISMASASIDVLRGVLQGHEVDAPKASFSR